MRKGTGSQPTSGKQGSSRKQGGGSVANSKPGQSSLSSVGSTAVMEEDDNVMFLEPYEMQRSSSSKRQQEDEELMVEVMEPTATWVYQEPVAALPVAEQPASSSLHQPSSTSVPTATPTLSINVSSLSGTHHQQQSTTTTTTTRGSSSDNSTAGGASATAGSLALVVGGPNSNVLTDVLISKRTDSSEAHAARIYKKNNVQQVSLWRHSTDSVRKNISQYPETWAGQCNTCHRTFTSIPIFPPDPENSYDDVHRTWILQIYAHCSKVCAKNPIVEGSSCKKDQLLRDLARFIREYFDPDCESIPYVPLSLVKEVNPLIGQLTFDQYDNIAGRCTAMITSPTFLFVNTSLEIRESKEQVALRNQRFEQSLNSKATPQQQEEFRKTTEMVLAKKREAAYSLQNSNIGRQLGLR